MQIINKYSGHRNLQQLLKILLESLGLLRFVSSLLQIFLTGDLFSKNMTIQFVVIIQFYTLIAVTNLTEATGKLRNNESVKLIF